MSNRYFDDEGSGELHPTARAWLERINAGQKATLELWRKRDGLTFKPAKMYMTFETPTGKQRESDDWDVDIDEPLIRAGVKATDAKNEAQRLSLMLRYWLSKLEERFGPGYFEAVLIDVVRTPELVAYPAVSAPQQKIQVTPAAREGHAYAACKEAIDGVIKRAATALTRDLKYGRREAENIHAVAIGQYLNERFHLEERRMLGLG